MVVLFWRLQVLGYLLDFKFYIFMSGNVSNITLVLQTELRKISYEDGRIEQLQDERRQLLPEIRNLKEKIDTFEAR